MRVQWALQRKMYIADYAIFMVWHSLRMTYIATHGNISLRPHLKTQMILLHGMYSRAFENYVMNTCKRTRPGMALFQQKFQEKLYDACETESESDISDECSDSVASRNFGYDAFRWNLHAMVCQYYVGCTKWKYFTTTFKPTVTWQRLNIALSRELWGTWVSLTGKFFQSADSEASKNSSRKLHAFLWNHELVTS